MKNYNIELVKDTETRNVLQHILQEGMGNIITLSAVPTATVPLLSPDEIGVYSNVLYVRKESTIYVITPSSTITVTV